MSQKYCHYMCFTWSVLKSHAGQHLVKANAAEGKDPRMKRGGATTAKSRLNSQWHLLNSHSRFNTKAALKRQRYIHLSSRETQVLSKRLRKCSTACSFSAFLDRPNHALTLRKNPTIDTLTCLLREHNISACRPVALWGQGKQNPSE